jgi:hypothetical protein
MLKLLHSYTHHQPSQARVGTLPQLLHIIMSLYQLRYRGNLVRNVKRDERRYYEELVEYSKKNLMLFPYHLSDVVIKGLRWGQYVVGTARC